MSGEAVYGDWAVSDFNRGSVFRLAALGCRLLPRDALYAISDSLMDWYQGIRPQVPAALEHNLLHAFPGLPPREARRLSGATFRTYGRGVVDYLRAPFDPPRVTPDPGAHERLASVAGGKILVTAHMGNWEVGGFFIGGVLGPHWIVAFPERDAAVDSFREARRSAVGHTTLSARSGLSTLVRLRAALEAGESVVVLADRAAGEDRTEVTFRGRPSGFLKSPALLSALTGAPLVPVAVVSEGPAEYRALVGEPRRPVPGENPSQAMQAVADFFGGLLERYPDQWYNFFRYWREGT